MALDRRDRYELVQALLRARDRKYEGNLPENVAQTGTASGDGRYGAPMFGGTGFSFAPQPDAATVDKTASQSHKLIPTPRPHPFRDPARFSDTGDVADMAEPRGFPVHDQLAFRGAPSTSSRLANPQTTYDRPLAVKTASVLPLRYWDYLWERSPSYCPPGDDNLTFPPLIYQDKAPLTEADKTDCHAQFDHDQKRCYENYNYDPRALRRCFERAEIIRDLCLRGERETSPWSDPDEDGVRFPKPRKGWKRK